MCAMTCPHDYPTPAACMDCINDDGLGAPPAREPEWVFSRPFVARFDSLCPLCTQQIEAGVSRVVMTTWDRCVHLGCPKPRPALL